MMDFTSLPTRKKSYGGANGNKICVIINDQLYMLKLPSHAPKNINLSYTNSCISEYLGCHIFNMLGMNAQETILGNYFYKDINRISVACKDFENNGYKLMDFASVKNQIIDSKSNGYGTDIKDIVETIEKQKIMDPIELSNHFWNMFVIDALIGNWDRHNGNWGFLYNQDTDDAYLAPIFDKIEPHTHLFVSKALFFLSIFEKKYRKISNYCAYVNEFSQLIYKVYKCIFLLCICH